ncbi:MAG: hypothetical protein AABZ80_01045 [Gemmatimonadota bacterium]
MTITARQSRLVLGLASLVALAACDSTDPLPPNPCVVTPGSCAANLSSDITSSRTLKKDTIYNLTGFVHVTGAGTVLTIEPGTVIKGTLNSALFILPGARINANGTAAEPIVLTSDQPVGSRKPGDWGGLILVGKGIINRSGTVDLEGTGSSTANYVVAYSGGADNSDNSGTLRYVRVEFAGFGVAANQELNSFTFAAIGSGTTLEYLQALGGLDDAYEWFGGAVDAKYLVSYETGDDHFDSSEGHTGRNQYLIGFQSVILQPRAGSGVVASDPQGFEVDGCGSASGSGCTLGFNSTPLNTPLFANFTMVGTGANTDVAATSGGIGMIIRRGTAGMYVNGLVARWPRAGLSLRDTDTQTRFTDGTAILRNVYVVETGTAGTNAPAFETGTGRFTIDATANNIISAAGTVTAASVLTALPATPANAAALDWSLVAAAAPATGGTGAFTGALATKGGTFVNGTAYRGAADPAGTKWWAGWTNYARN